MPIVLNSIPGQIQTQQTNKKYWEFKNAVNAENNNESTELRIDGNIMDSEDAWLYEWFGIPVASPNAFRNELAKNSGKDITVWIDSYGGSAFAGIGLYNALIEHKKSGAKVTTVIDSKAMSAATLPYMAGDERLISVGGMFMVHNPLSSASGYATELRKCADVLDEVTQNLINIYESSTGLSRDSIASFMDNESYMSANKAIKEGFCTGLLKNEANNQNQVLNFSFDRFAIMNMETSSMQGFYEALKNNKILTDNIQNRPTFPVAAVVTPPANPVVDIKNNIQEVKKEMEIKNSAEFKTQLPTIHDEVFNSGIAVGKTDGIKAERERMKAFDVLNGKVDPEFLAKAKDDDSATAESTLFKAMQEGKMINSAYVAQAESDAAKANQVPGASSDNVAPDEVTGILNKVTSVVSKTLGLHEGGKK